MFLKEEQYIAPTLEANIRSFIILLLNEDAYNKLDIVKGCGG